MYPLKKKLKNVFKTRLSLPTIYHDAPYLKYMIDFLNIRSPNAKFGVCGPVRSRGVCDQ